MDILHSYKVHVGSSTSILLSSILCLIFTLVQRPQERQCNNGSNNYFENTLFVQQTDQIQTSNTFPRMEVEVQRSSKKGSSSG